MGLNILLACGGTGGHVFPAIAVGRALRRRHGIEPHVAGRPGSLEERAAVREGFKFHPVPAVPLHRFRPWRNASLPLSVFNAVRAARLALGRSGARAVLGTGGYVSLPTGIAARLARVPLILHESNAFPGLANRMLTPFARSVLAGSEAAAQKLGKAEVCGVPVREIDNGVLRTGEDRILLVMGGSQGAAGVNRLVRQDLSRLVKAGWKVVWQTGHVHHASLLGDQELALPGVQIEPFFDDVYAQYARARLVVCRSGASTLGELALFALPAVLIPYPHATGDHQRHNALERVRGGTACLLDEALAQPGDLSRTVADLEARAALAVAALKLLASPHAAETIADRVASAAKEIR